MSVQSEEREWQEMNKVKAPACHGEEFGLDPDVLGSHLRLLSRCGLEERAGDGLTSDTSRGYAVRLGSGRGGVSSRDLLDVSSAQQLHVISSYTQVSFPEVGRERWSQVGIQMAKRSGPLDVGLLGRGEQAPRQACTGGSGSMTSIWGGTGDSSLSSGGRGGNSEGRKLFEKVWLQRGGFAFFMRQVTQAVEMLLRRNREGEAGARGAVEAAEQRP